MYFVQVKIKLIIQYPKIDRSILIMFLFVLISSLFFFNIELELYWSPSQTQTLSSSSQNIEQELSLNKNIYKEGEEEEEEIISKEESDYNNLLINDKKFNELLSYYSMVSNVSPSSWIHLNEQLFCPISYSQSLYPTQSIISNAGERLLKYIYDIQFIKDCDNPSHKYIIFDISQTGGTGIGATFNGGILKYFARAIMSQRIFLINGKFEWAEGNKYCDEYDGMQCYFLPLSNCDANDILSKTDKNEIWTGGVPTHCTLGDDQFDDNNKNKLNWCTERVIYANKRSSGWNPKNQDINMWINKHFKHKNQSIFSNFVQFKAILQAFIFRLKPKVRVIIMEKVRNAFIKSLSFKNNKNENVIYKFDPFKSVSFPIRASDKCHENKLGLNGEMQCWTKEEIFYIIQSIHVLNKNINTLIFTSEDFHFIDKLLSCIKYQINCQNTTKMNIFENYLDFKWKIIINYDDTKPSIGNAKFKIYQQNNDKKFNFENNIGIDLKHDVVVGAFSSLLLQMNSKYVIYTKSSSWLDNIWTMAKGGLNCESILFSQQMEINGFISKTSINVDPLVKKEYNRLNNKPFNRPNFLPQYFKKYEFLNRYCFEMKQFGTLNKKTKWKHVLYPPDIWDKIHSLNLNPELFYSLFNIQIYQNGWDNFCDRYTKLPFDTNEDVGV